MPRIAPALLEIERYPFRHSITTRFADMDHNEHINNVAIAMALEDARFRFDRAANVHEYSRGHRILLAACHIDYLAEAHYPEPLDSYVGIMDIGRTSWTQGCVIAQGTRICAFAKSVSLCADENGPVPLPEALQGIFAERRIA